MGFRGRTGFHKKIIDVQVGGRGGGAGYTPEGIGRKLVKKTGHHPLGMTLDALRRVYLCRRDIEDSFLSLYAFLSDSLISTSKTTAAVGKLFVLWPGPPFFSASILFCPQPLSLLHNIGLTFYERSLYCSAL